MRRSRRAGRLAPVDRPSQGHGSRAERASRSAKASSCKRLIPGGISGAAPRASGLTARGPWTTSSAGVTVTCTSDNRASEAALQGAIRVLLAQRRGDR
jgi:hypothetical protein